MSSNDLRAACRRSQDLVSYLYGETSEIEAKGFERHLSECITCRQEHASFGALRPSFENIRQRAAESFQPLDLEFIDSPAQLPRTTKHSSRPSALAAFKEFFRLAPGWVQVGAVAAALMFCVLASLAVFNSEIRVAGTRIALRPVPAPSEDLISANRNDEKTQPSVGLYTKAEVDELVAEHELALRSEFEAQKVSNNVAVLEAKGSRKQNSLRLRPSNRSATAAGRAQPAQPSPLMAQPRQRPNLLDDEDEPQLSDLLSQVK